MAFAFQLNVAVRNAACDAITALIDVGGAGTLKVYTGAQPATPATAPSGTLLATLTFSATAFLGAAAGIDTADTITPDSSVDNTGTAGWFRIADGAGTAIADGEVGTSGADLNFDSVSFVAGGTAAISSLTITVPAT